ncbi:MAG TPA: peptidoglycan DD-metalloendopeptidase family protein [Usitatibacter sp.]|nr:peptidoglycan DD-metalloendopeptidase family protein [Usitatibacter sp.]
MRLSRIAALVLVAAVAAACAAPRPAPVIERAPLPAPPPVVQAPPPPPPEPEKPVPTHTVKRGETLVGIALQYGLDYRDLVAWNNVTNPNRIEVGQVLVLAAPAGAPAVAAPLNPPGGPVTTPLAQPGPPIEARPLANTAATKVEPRASKVPFSDRALAQMTAPDAGGSPVGAAPPEMPAPGVAPPAPPVEPPAAAKPPEPEKPAGTDNEDVDWTWPVKGKVLAPFSEATKGMDIAGKKGAPVLAAASGRVVYAGVGLRGYGKLVIIKHNNTWLSAYAHNDNILVKEQQDVRKGQKIAEMGSTDADTVKLHFEVRRQGKPVDPAKYLPAM